jgi:hypothetical protein
MGVDWIYMARIVKIAGSCEHGNYYHKMWGILVSIRN